MWTGMPFLIGSQLFSHNMGDTGTAVPVLQRRGRRASSVQLLRAGLELLSHLPLFSSSRPCLMEKSHTGTTSPASGRSATASDTPT